jgi:hypothetical protein
MDIRSGWFTRHEYSTWDTYGLAKRMTASLEGQLLYASIAD